MQNTLRQLDSAERKCETAIATLRRIREDIKRDHVQTWEKTAWNKLWRAATDAEASAMHDAAVRAGVLWKCSCGFFNRSSTETCTHCDCGVKEHAAPEG
jgi:hypothetical protein